MGVRDDGTQASRAAAVEERPLSEEVALGGASPAPAEPSTPDDDLQSERARREGEEAMSYSISGSGHGADTEKAKQAFADLDDALDEATAEGGSKFSGQISGSEDGKPFSLSAAEAREQESTGS
jgi:hypothetical protein